jgi:hypothetical protein
MVVHLRRDDREDLNSPAHGGRVEQRSANIYARAPVKTESLAGGDRVPMLSSELKRTILKNGRSWLIIEAQSPWTLSIGVRVLGIQEPAREACKLHR